MELSRQEGVNAIIHLYRGELGRMTAYRVRLDTTTRWAVATSAAIMSFALSNARVPHLVFLLAVWLNLLFLWLEARRYRGYALIRHRVRLIERGFYGLVLGGAGAAGAQGSEDAQGGQGDEGAGAAAADASWRQALYSSLQAPAPGVGYLAACAVRLRRAYLWLLAAVYGAWLVKLHGHGGIPGGAAVGPLSGAGVMAIACSLLAVLTVLAAVFWPPEEE